MNFITKAFSKPVQPEIAGLIKAEMYEAQCALLKAQTELDHAKASVDYNTARLKRLMASNVSA
jgi:hypothetical protein